MNPARLNVAERLIEQAALAMLANKLIEILGSEGFAQATHIR